MLILIGERPADRAAAETLEIEIGARSGAEDATRQPVFNSTATIQVAEERDRIAKKPCPGTRNGRQNWRWATVEHWTQYAVGLDCFPEEKIISYQASIECDWDHMAGMLSG